jgi:hypothetical protein
MFNSNEVLTALEKALNTSQLYMVYQPIFNLHAQCISGFEALMRWNSPQMGMISPDVFITLLEDSGNIISIEDMVTTLRGMLQLPGLTPLYYPSIFPRSNSAILCYPNASDKILPPPDCRSIDAK